MIAFAGRNVCSRWIKWIVRRVAMIFIAFLSSQRVSAWQSQRPFLLMASVDKGTSYHRYQPPVKTSVMKQLMQGRTSQPIGSNTGGGITNVGSEGTSSNGGNSSAKGGTSRPSTAQSAFSGSIALPPPSFEQRMRDMVLGKPKVESHRDVSATKNSVKRMLPANVHVIDTLHDYKVVVGDERQKIVAVRFYATYCKACQAVAPHFYRLATQYPNVIFIDVPVTERNAALHQGLGISTLPFAHIYHPLGGLVEEQKFTRRDVPSFEEKLSNYVAGSCSIPAPSFVSSDAEQL